MVGFTLKNTLSENGSVTRGICELDDCGQLTAVHETSNIVKTADGAAVKDGDMYSAVNPDAYVSMNMWGLTPDLWRKCWRQALKNFFANMGEKRYFKRLNIYSPIYIDKLLQAGKVSVNVLDSHDKWFGVT